MTKPERISFAFICATILLVGWLHLATPMIAVMFSYLALSKLHFVRNKWIAITLFLIVVTVILGGMVIFVKQAMVTVPKIAETSIPSIIDFAKKKDIELPFEDLESLKDFITDDLMSKLKYVGNFAHLAIKEFIALIIGVVVAVSMFLNARMELGRDSHQFKNNLYSTSGDYVSVRFRRLYQSFSTVMGAQVIISAINTALTSVFVLWSGLPYASFVIALTFFVGLLPIIGNLVSNTVIVGIAFTVSPKFALVALGFLVVLHKLEYFLNSKIVGDRIKNPMWLTLLGMVVGEKLMGVPGMMLAPVVLHYIKTEASQIEVVELSGPPAHSRSVPTKEASEK